jgi:hypothetical protein
MKRTFSLLAVASLFACASLACGSSSRVSGGVDAATACTELCTTSGFAGGRADIYEHEVNCFCNGGNAAARVTAAACTQTCTELGWSAGEAFSVSACQCH